VSGGAPLPLNGLAADVSRMQRAHKTDPLLGDIVVPLTVRWFVGTLLE
jgi:hypothetical protein